MSKGFLPADDQGLSWYSPRPRKTCPFTAMTNMQRQVAEIVMQPYVAGAMSSVGAGGPSAPLNV